ncbi:MAG: PIG-L family deacetylase [Polyangiaceae bacterium]|nr:PIG-L family deacetylase [Polyangiaceae bacterium]
MHLPIRLASLIAIAGAISIGCAGETDLSPDDESLDDVISTEDAVGTTCAKGSVLGFYAHGDDPLLFSNPTIGRDIAAGKCVTTLYATSGYGAKGDCKSADFCRSQREKAALFSFAKMANVPNEWSTRKIMLDRKWLTLYALKANDRIRVSFLGLPCSGYNYAASDFGTPLAEVFRTKSSATSLDGARVYNHEALVRTVASAISIYRIDTVRTTNPDVDHDAKDPKYYPDDHPDHVTVAKIVKEALAASKSKAAPFYYSGYSVKDYPENLSAKEISSKIAIARNYSSIDFIGTGGECDPGVVSPEFGCDGYRWLRREYDQKQRAAALK